MPYVPENQRSTAWYLFHKLFRVRVNTHKIRSIEEIQQYGTYTTGIPEYDRELEKADTVVMISIAQMEDIYNNGYTVKVINREDTVLIYKYIADHLQAMKVLMGESENIAPNNETLDELIRLDRFAADVFGYARHFTSQEASYKGLARAMTSSRSQALDKLRRGMQDGMKKKSANSANVGGGGRNYDEEPIQEEAVKNEEGVETVAPYDDSRLPKHISLERVFENQKQRGLDYR